MYLLISIFYKTFRMTQSKVIRLFVSRRIVDVFGEIENHPVKILTGILISSCFFFEQKWVVQKIGASACGSIVSNGAIF